MLLALNKNTPNKSIISITYFILQLLATHFSFIINDVGVHNYSHSIVTCGLEVMAYATLFIPRTSLIILFVTRPRKSYENGK